MELHTEIRHVWVPSVVGAEQLEDVHRKETSTLHRPNTHDQGYLGSLEAWQGQRSVTSGERHVWTVCPGGHSGHPRTDDGDDRFVDSEVPSGIRQVHRNERSTEA